jgi:pimeloyl-ACP methyl ester carboxylesterase/DNA-binding SARP family transcriptional activator
VEVPPIRFALSRGARIAYQQWGEGVDLVAVPPLAQNIEAAWGWPDVVRMFERYGRIGRFLHYDKRGTGASDRIRGVPGLDERVDDMRAVMDDAGVERAWLCGFSDGGATSLLFAATYPDRVHGVVLFGSGASTFPERTPELADRWTVAKPTQAALWGTSESPFVDHFAPSLAHDQAYRTWHQRYERSCCDSETLADLLQMSWETDVSEVLPQVLCPVLLLHREDDRIVDADRSREAAALLPDATLRLLPGEDHFGYAGDMDAWLDELERFVTGRVSEAPTPTTRPSVRVVTLGRFAVEVDGREVPTSAWGSRHARTIVKRLAVARGWPVRREELFELLWPHETDRAKVGARLSVQLSTVRRILGGGVAADRETIRLDLDEVGLDLVELARAEDDLGVVAAYGGTFLPDDLDQPWTAATRAEIQARFASAAARAAERYLALDLPGAAAQVARRLLESDPHDLRGHELLVTALLGTDQIAATRQAHAAWVAAGEELGVRVAPLEPS